uniref:Uncharacterized protein n=1 Tax=Opuntia streptacantha TaxID=393608 RepID=A0A7C9E9A3_OPUST
MKEEAALWRTLTPIKRVKDALSCSKTYFTVVPFKDAIRSETHVLETIKNATASNWAPWLLNIVGTNILNMFAILRGDILEDILSCGTWGNVAASSTAADAPMTSES